MASTTRRVESSSRLEDDAQAAEVRARAEESRRIKVVEVGTGVEHELAGDTPTRDARTMAYFSYPSGAVLPLVMRAGDTAFYVCGEEWTELFGKLVRRAV